MGTGTIGVIGAGVMGHGIAQLALSAGMHVILTDATEELARAGASAIGRRFDRMVKKGDLDQAAAEEMRARLAVAGTLSALVGADAVIEAVTERLEVKQDVFRQLGAITRPDALLATNTSGLSITAIAAAAVNPERVAGIHFFNPPPVMRLVEVVRGLATSAETVARARALAERLGKDVIVCDEQPLFVVNRILVPMVNEAIFVLQEGIATREEIDRGLVLGANHPIGPLALADMIGLDTLLFVVETLHRETGEDKYRPAPLLRKMVRAGYLGRKTGRGFFEYQS